MESASPRPARRIVAHLAPSFEPLSGPMRLDRCGTGFGTSRLPGTSNILRLLAFEPDDRLDATVHQERIAVCEFEIDDQTGEDLALALARLRISMKSWTYRATR